jgi:cytochrome c-type biogenesis protein CcmH
MSLWLLMTMLCSAVAVFVSIPLIRKLDSTKPAIAQDTAIYQDQLKEVDRDLQGGSINAPEAESAKVEIQRRLNTAEKNATEARPVSNLWRNVALAATAGLVILGSVNLYNLRGSPDLPSVANNPVPAQPVADNSATPAAPPVANATSTPGQVEAMVAKLQARLQANPKDAEGWRMLGWSQFNLQHFTESTDAYGKALELDPNNTEYKSAYAEAITQSAQGVVTPKALGLIAEVLAKDPKDARARFYDALSHEQSGDQKGALDRWLSLYADAPADAGWREDVKQRITDLAKTTGVDVSAQLAMPKLPAAPTSEQKPMGQAEKDAMVAGMISKLATKLESNPKDRDGWAMMIRSLIVTGDKKGADEALAKALDIFKDDKATVDGLKSIAAEAAAKTTATPPAAATAAPPAAGTASAIPPTASAPAITDEQKAQVQALAPADQQEMIKGMVARLASKMEANPNDFDGWIRLMRAYKVLNQADKAKEALAKALAAFATDTASGDKLKAAAAELGIN